MGKALQILVSIILLGLVLGLLNTFNFNYLTNMITEPAIWILSSLYPLSGFINIQRLYTDLTILILFELLFWSYRIILFFTSIVLAKDVGSHKIHGNLNTRKH